MSMHVQVYAKQSYLDCQGRLVHPMSPLIDLLDHVNWGGGGEMFGCHETGLE